MYKFVCEILELCAAASDSVCSSLFLSYVDLLEAVLTSSSPLFNLYVNLLVNQIKKKTD